MLVCEVKGDLYRSVTPPTAETSVNGPKDSFNESILMNKYKKEMSQATLLAL